LNQAYLRAIVSRVFSGMIYHLAGRLKPGADSSPPRQLGGINGPAAADIQHQFLAIYGHFAHGDFIHPLEEKGDIRVDFFG
jgi:hypothetical protein